MTTAAELTIQLSEAHMSAFSILRELSHANPDYLAACGYRGKTNAEAVLAAFLAQDKKIEKMIQAWEKANPL